MRERIADFQLNRRNAPLFLVGALVLFALLYILFITKNTGTGWRVTNYGSAWGDPGAFIRTVLDAFTRAGWLFMVASGFALIFGLLRVVNMAHGSFYLLGGYIAYEVQQAMTGHGYALQTSEINTWEWVLPLLVAAPCIAVVGFVVQQVFLRWNQGQELRQALITIAISVIIADQIIAHFPRNVGTNTQQFGGNAVSLAWPGWLDRFVNLRVAWGWTLLIWLVLLGGIALAVRTFVRRHNGMPTDQAVLVTKDDPKRRRKEIRFLVLFFLGLLVVVDIVLAFAKPVRGWIDAGTSLHSIAGVSYSGTRLALLVLGLAVGIGLWIWLYRTRTGMVIRAGVDDRKMTAALGINIQKTFAIAFIVGSALAAFGAVVGASQSNISSGQDDQWLLYSLVVVIVGGMGSIFGAAVGSLLYAFVEQFSSVYLPSSLTQYSVVFTFVLIALVLAFRPQGLFGRPG